MGINPRSFALCQVPYLLNFSFQMSKDKHDLFFCLAPSKISNPELLRPYLIDVQHSLVEGRREGAKGKGSRVNMGESLRDCSSQTQEPKIVHRYFFFF